MDLDRCITRSPAASAIRTRLRAVPPRSRSCARSEEHTSELQSRLHLVCRLLLEKKKHTFHAFEQCADPMTQHPDIDTKQLPPPHTHMHLYRQSLFPGQITAEHCFLSAIRRGPII